MTESFLFSRLESIDERLHEVELLTNLAEENQKDDDLYSTYCRAAHILLVAHFEGIIKDICKDIIADINYNNNYDTVPDKIFSTFCEYFLIKEKKEFTEKNINILRTKLKEIFGNNKSNLRVDPFFYPSNKNLAPEIIETILLRFGKKRFFWSIKNSDIDIVFEDVKTETDILKAKLKTHIKDNILKYPYNVNDSIYNPDSSILEQKTEKTLWEEFIDNLLKERHNIVHGQRLDNPYDHYNIKVAKNKIEVLIYVFVINICMVSNPKPL